MTSTTSFFSRRTGSLFCGGLFAGISLSCFASLSTTKNNTTSSYYYSRYFRHGNQDQQQAGEFGEDLAFAGENYHRPVADINTFKDVGWYKNNKKPFSTMYRNYVLGDIIQLSHDVCLFRFLMANADDEFHLKPCSTLQARVVYGGGWTDTIQRYYTPVTPNGAKGYFDLIVKRKKDGRMTSHLFGMRIGDSLQFRCVMFKLSYRPNRWEEIGMICGGTGFTPMLQVIRHALKPVPLPGSAEAEAAKEEEEKQQQQQEQQQQLQVQQPQEQEQEQHERRVALHKELEEAESQMLAKNESRTNTEQQQRQHQQQQQQQQHQQQQQLAEEEEEESHEEQKEEDSTAVLVVKQEIIKQDGSLASEEEREKLRILKLQQQQQELEQQQQQQQQQQNKKKTNANKKKIKKPEPDRTKLSLLFCNRSENHILLKPLFEKLADEYPERFRCAFCVDKPLKPEQWTGYTGYVSKKMVQETMPPPGKEKTMILLCGPDHLLHHVSGTSYYALDELSKGKPTQPGGADLANLTVIRGLLGEMGYDQNQVYKF